MVDIALVTGAAGNLGRAVAVALAAQGWRLALLDRDGAALAMLAAALPGEGHVVLAGVDLADAVACTAAVAQTGTALAGVVHTVGGFAAGAMADGGLSAFEPMFRLNLLTTANLFAAALPPMRAAGRGSLVAIGAMAALRAPGGLAAYAAAKSGVLRLVEATAEEVKAEGIRVNALLPGTIDTPQNRASMPDADTSRWVAPAQLAEAAAFLLSPAASGVTGALLPVTGRG